MAGDRDRPDDSSRLEEFMEIIAALAAGERPRRATILGDGSILDGIGTGLDLMADEIADRRAREEELHRRMLQAERLAAVGQLAAGVAHEINNPAAFLLANMTAMEESVATLARALAAARAALAGHPEALRAADGALRAADADGILDELGRVAADNLEGIRRIAAITRALLGFSRMHADRIGPTALDRVAEEACRVAAAEVGRHARLVRRLEPVPALAADHGKLVQVATNLLLNAAQAIPEGAADRHEVEVSTACDGATVVLRVRDDGVGIPAEVQPRIFEPFFTTKPRGVGTGLGLPISAEIVRLHGGELRFRSEPGRGTTFEVVLPLVTGMVASAPPPAAPRPAARQRPRVLLVDDEPALLDAYRRSLGDELELTLAAGGGEAIAALDARQDWDAILCDVVMPEPGSEAVFSHVERRHPALRGRLAFCSGGPFTPAARRLVERLGEALLTKPLEREEVLRVVRRLARSAG